MEYIWQAIKQEGIEFGDEISFKFQDGDRLVTKSGKFDGADAMGLKLAGGSYYEFTHIDSTTLEKTS